MNTHAEYLELSAFEELFEDVQLSGIFPDSKTFNDCVPRFEKDHIRNAYREQKLFLQFDLKEFIEHNFILTTQKATEYTSDSAKPIEQHIDGLWAVLTRQPDQVGGSLIPLPYPYIVPGGRFQEIYYWDSYFTMLGLSVSGRFDLIENMVDNFSFLIKTLGHIPNGNRAYYISRSQPPFFTLMVELLQEDSNHDLYLKYLSSIEKEYNFWMSGFDSLENEWQAHRRVVKGPKGALLNRYYDDRDTPRPEAYKEDIEIAHASLRKSSEVYRDLRAAAESGWDFSSRWLADGKHLEQIITTQIIPIDLNCLLYHIETILEQSYHKLGDVEQQEKYAIRAQKRKNAILELCWNQEKQLFFDYNFYQQTQTQVESLASAFPLFFKIATKDQASAMALSLEIKFLKDGGLVTTTLHTGQQWDSPNGWAPLQWIAYKGLRFYQHDALALKIRESWLETNQKVYTQTGKMTEKYNIVNTTLHGGGGEYPNQDGFGWTNGVFLKLLSDI